MRRPILGRLLGCSILLALPANAADVVPVTVPATANIYGSGHTVAPAPGGSGAGVLPTEVTLPPGVGRIVTFTSVSGNIDFGPCCASNAPDGVTGLGTGPSNSWDGIGGMTIARGRFLGAVFLDASEPSDPPPAPLSIPDIGFTSLAPGLRQTFFVGDGLSGDGTGDVQIFQVPDTATRLFLGVHDAGPPDTSLPGWYGDNSGSVSGNIEISRAFPLPALGAFGLLALAASLVASAGLLRSIRS